MHRFTLRFFVRLALIALGVGLAACGGSTNACPSGFVAMDGVCLPEADAGTPVDGAMADADMADADVADGALADGALADAALDGDLVDGSPGTTTYYADMDMDGFGDPSTPMDAEVAPDGYVEDATDCDDTAMDVHPGATEVCNGVDDNCDGVVDEGVTTTYYADTDDDTFGDPSATMDACEAPSGYVSDSTDCDDTAMDVHPGATEVCNGVDDNCDGVVDEGVTTTYYADTDGDTFGDPSATMDACEAPSGYVSDSTDCDDATRGVHPGATEACNGVDDDCSGAVDDGLTAPACALTAGVCAGATQACGGRAGWAACAGSASYGANYEAGAETSCDGSDNDCDGTVDEGTRTAFYADCDGDGARDVSVRRNACDAPGALAYFVANGHPGCLAALPSSAPQDCDDTRASVHPGAPEVCNGVDDNCNGTPDDGLTFRNYYRDGDRDGFGDPGVRRNACARPSGYVTDNTDCADGDANAHPGQAAFFTTRIVGSALADPLRYDYDCDRAILKQYRVVAVCSSTLRAGWDGPPIPYCGDARPYTPLVGSGIFTFCGSLTSRTQACH